MFIHFYFSRYSKMNQIFSDAGQQPYLWVGQEPQPDWRLRLHVKPLYGTEKAFGLFSHFSFQSPSDQKTSRHDIIGINQADLYVY